MTGRHGSRTAYRGGCRCAECRKANTEYHREIRRRRSELDPSLIPHGLGGYGNYGCRCEVCRAAHGLRMRRRARAAGPAAESRPGRSTGAKWSDAEIQLVLQRADDGRYRYTAAEAAVKVGRSVGAVDRKRASDLGQARAEARADYQQTLRKRKNAGLAEKAKRSGLVWTGPELEIATRPDLTAAEAAAMLGRTLRAVHTVRARCIREPKMAALLGQWIGDLAERLEGRSA